MQTLDMSLRKLFQNKMISREEVLNRAHEPEILFKSLGG
jgi:Tfp pilus assembly pilus retraction ATPase PilT